MTTAACVCVHWTISGSGVGPEGGAVRFSGGSHVGSDEEHRAVRCLRAQSLHEGPRLSLTNQRALTRCRVKCETCHVHVSRGSELMRRPSSRSSAPEATMKCWRSRRFTEKVGSHILFLYYSAKLKLSSVKDRNNFTLELVRCD